MRAQKSSVAVRSRRRCFGVALHIGVLTLLGGLGGTGAALADTCTVPSARYRTIQSAANDMKCTEISLGERIYTEQLSLNRASGLLIRGVGAGRTVIVSPTTRARSSVSTSYLPLYTFVIEVRPGTSATLQDLTIDGFSNARCGERYFGVRYSRASGELNRVVVENVRGRGTDFACANVIAVGVTSETGAPAGSATLKLHGSTIRSFQQTAIVANGPASLTVEDTVIHGAGTQSQLAQSGLVLQAGAGGSLDRVTITDMNFSGDVCKGLGTGVKIASAAATTVKRCVLRTLDRGMLLSKNGDGVVSISDNRFVETLSGILSTDNVAAAMGGTPIIQLSKNGFISIKRSTAANVATCFADSGDGIAIRNEKDSVVEQNSAADSARCAIELLGGTSNLDVHDNQLTRSARVDLEDTGSGNRLNKNLCQSSTPTGLCAGEP